MKISLLCMVLVFMLFPLQIVPRFNLIYVHVHTSNATTWAVEEIHRDLASGESHLDFWYFNRTGDDYLIVTVYDITLNYTIRVYKLTNNSDFFSVVFEYGHEYSIQEVENGTGYVEMSFWDHLIGPDIALPWDDGYIPSPFDWFGWAFMFLIIILAWAITLRRKRGTPQEVKHE